MLSIVDRFKEVIIVGSCNVYPADVESVLADCAEIAESAVVGRADDELGEVPVAFVVLGGPARWAPTTSSASSKDGSPPTSTRRT